MKRSWWLVVVLSVVLGCDAGGANVDAAASASASASTAKKPPGPADAEADERCGGEKGDEARQCLEKLAGERLHKGKDQEAANALVRAVHAAPKKKAPWMQLADVLRASDDYAAVAKVLAQAKCHVADAELSAVHIALADIHMQEDRVEDAVGEFEAARAAAPDDPAGAFNLGMAYAKLSPPKKGEAVAALEDFRKAGCGAKSKQFAAECAYTTSVLAKLEGTEPTPAKVEKKGRPKDCRETIALPKITVKTSEIKDGAAHTVWGAAHHLRIEALYEEVTAKPITVIGHVVATNYAEVPACAIHEPGEESPPDCTAPVPTFSIAATAGEKKVMIKVVGWASNWAQIVGLVKLIDEGSAEAGDYLDAYSGKKMPVPIPEIGAKVRVTGKYGFSAIVGTRGVTANPRYGVINYDSLETVTPAPKKATLPGLERK